MVNENILLEDIKKLVFEINAEISYNDYMNFAEQGIDSLDYAFIVVNLEKNHGIDVLNLEIAWNKITTPYELATVFLKVYKNE